MKNKKWLLISLLFVFLISACGPSQEDIDATSTQVAASIFATQTAQVPTPTQTFTPSPTSTPTNTPTSTPSPTFTPLPTDTPTPKPALSDFVLTLDDLPAGFEPLPEDQMADFGTNVPGGAGFGFINQDDFTLLMGIYFPFPSAAEQMAFDAGQADFLNMFASVLGAEVGTDALTGLENIGETRIGMTASGAMMSVTMQWDLVSFRRGEVGVILILGYPEGSQPSITITELSSIVDEKVMDYLDTVN